MHKSVNRFAAEFTVGYTIGAGAVALAKGATIAVAGVVAAKAALGCTLGATATIGTVCAYKKVRKIKRNWNLSNMPSGMTVEGVIIED